MSVNMLTQSKKRMFEKNKDEYTKRTLVSITKRRIDFPIWGAARPTPLAEYIVSHIFIIKEFNSLKLLSIGLAFFFKIGDPYAKIGNIKTYYF